MGRKRRSVDEKNRRKKRERERVPSSEEKKKTLETSLCNRLEGKCSSLRYRQKWGDGDGDGDEDESEAMEMERIDQHPS